VQAFLSIAQDSALGDYFLKNLVRHICGFEEEDLVVLAMGVLSNYRWLRAVASRQSLSFAASQYYAVVSRVRELRLSSERSVGTDEKTDFMLVFTRDLESIADILRFFVPPEAVILTCNEDQNLCPVHGKWSVGDPGLAHQLFGRLLFVRSDESSLVLNTCG
jgi:hypothetical protein